MTFQQVVATAIRRWYVMILALLFVVGYTSILLQGSGLYSTRTVVYFAYIQPNMVNIGPDNGTENEGLIAFAGAVASEINNGRPVSRYAWDDAPLYGAGMQQGVLVGLADTGGQWMNSYNRAEIEIQIVGQSRDWVEETQTSLLSKVFERAQTLQGTNYDDPRRRVTTEISPLTSTIEHVTVSPPEKIAAIAASGTAAIILGAWVAMQMDRAKAARQRRRVESQKRIQENSRRVAK